MLVSVRTLRRQMALIAARAASGETVVVVRHGQAWAVLRRRQPGERCRRCSVTAFRGDLRRGVLRAGRRPLCVAWADQPLEVVVTRVPRDLVLSEQQP